MGTDLRTRYHLDLWAILVLVILNISLLGLFWYEHFRKPPPPAEARSDPEEFLIQQLQLDQVQTDSVRALRREHFAQTDPIRSSMVRTNMRMMEELFAQSPDTALVRRLSEQIGREQAEFDRQVYRHFSNVKAVLRPDQYDRFRSLIIEALERKLPASDAVRKESPDRSDEPRPQDRNDRRPPPRDDRRPPPPNDERRPSGG
ncbi:hypothetical protein C3F09_04525 [candidate division GN15 bacterium]|uniref:Periplasmic heavy metal sensor n=1 Tax=candidate division GN15 bacterium TaxID=2072418 RepID=A0A855X7X5_9BACT|nr:MAG: hypothetical protein C3F09_04525 [candidate division GN15 bacterium]